MNYNPTAVTVIGTVMKANNVDFIRFGMYEWEDNLCFEDAYLTIEYVPGSEQEALYNSLEPEQKKVIHDALIDQVGDCLHLLAMEFPISTSGGISGLFEFTLKPLQITKVGELYLSPVFESLPNGPITIELTTAMDGSV